MDKKWGGASFTKPENLKKLKKQEKFQKPKNFPEPKSVFNSKSFTKSKNFTKSDHISNSDKDINLVYAKRIIDQIQEVEKRYEESAARTKDLLSYVNKTQTSINQVVLGEKGRSWGSLDKEALLSLITDVNRAMSNSISSIGDLIKNNNENTKNLADMISALTVLSTLSFEQIRETTSELEGIAGHLQKSTRGTNVQGTQIKKIIVSQIEKFKEEKERAIKIENNFSVIFQKLREGEEYYRWQREGIDKSFKFQKDEAALRIEKMENGLAEVVDGQKSKIKFLSIFLITNLLITLVLISYFILNQ